MNKKENLKLNLIFNVIYQVVAVLSPLLITPKLSRVFGADYIGVRSFTFSIVYYFAIFGVLGLDMYGQRKIALEKDDDEKRSHSFWIIFSTRFLLVGIATTLFIGYFLLFSSSDFERLIFCCWLIYLFREMINPIWFLQGIEKYRFISILSILSHVLYVTFTLAFINEKSQLPLYIVFFTAIPLLISFFYWPLVLKNVKRTQLVFKEMIGSIKESFVYFVPTIAVAIYSMVDKTMLGFFDSSKISTGLYESAEKLIKVALSISTASFTIMRTRMSYIYGKKDSDSYDKYSHTFMSLSLFLCWPIMFGIIGISKDFVPVFFGEGFEDVVKLSYVFSLVVPCLTISGLLQAIFIFPYGLQKTMDLYYVLIVAVNIVMNIILIITLGTVGAIIASVFAEFMLAVILIIRARKDIDVKFLFFGSIKYLIAAIGMFLVIMVISNYVNVGTIYKLIIEFTAAVVTYFVLCYLMADKFIITQTKNIYRKIFRRRGN